MFELFRSGSGMVRPAPASEACVCVFLTCFPSDFEFLATLVRHADVRVRHAQSIAEADILLEATGARVLLCDTVFPDGNWLDCADMLALSHRDVSLLVLAEEVDQPFVSGAVGRGACAVAWKPINPQMRHLIVAAHEAAAQRGDKRACLP